jgi:hydroxymethylglutaryl-CoA synthase
MPGHFDSTSGSASVLDGSLVLPASAIRGRSVAGGDEDAVTLAAEAALPLLAGIPQSPRILILATTAPPYDDGGSVQALAELTGLAGDTLAFELTSSLRDGLTAVRLAAALVAAQGGTALVCAAHRARGEKDAGDGAAALLLAAGGGVATLTPGPSRAEELRDRWRLAHTADLAEGDPSFVWDIGIPRVAREWELEAPSLVAPVARTAARAERSLGGPGDELAGAVGVLGAAHALGRLVLALDREQVVAAASGGLAEALASEPLPGAEEIAGRARDVLAAPRVATPPEPVDWSLLTPYASGPRSWRERAQDLRLEGARCGGCGRMLFPPPVTCPRCGSRELLTRAGTVVTGTRDHAYPVSRSTGMAVVELDGGGRFYGQVVPSAQLTTGDRVRLVPRRLHDGGGAAQYFWKVAPEAAR